MHNYHVTVDANTRVMTIERKDIRKFYFEDIIAVKRRRQHVELLVKGMSEEIEICLHIENGELNECARAIDRLLSTPSEHEVPRRGLQPRSQDDMVISIAREVLRRNQTVTEIGEGDDRGANAPQLAPPRSPMPDLDQVSRCKYCLGELSQGIVGRCPHCGAAFGHA